MKIAKDEIYLFGFLSLFAILWVVLVTPRIEYSALFLNLNPVIQYFVFNIGFIIFAVLMINLPYRFIKGKKLEPKNIIKVGIAGWLGFSFVFDMWQPPYYLSSTGQVLITSQQALPSTAVDAMTTYIWSLVIPQSSVFMGLSTIYIFVYFVTPIIAVLDMMLILKPSLFRKMILER